MFSRLTGAPEALKSYALLSRRPLTWLEKKLPRSREDFKQLFDPRGWPIAIHAG
jgi:hypothetical protein